MAEKVEDLNLPNASITKIIKEAIPESVNIAKDARTALAKAAAVFVMYISSHASQEAQKVGRKTMMGQDVIDALGNLEFDQLIEPLNEYLNAYKVAQKTKKDAVKKGKQRNENDKDEDEEGEEDLNEERT